jgi:predicted metal-dependent hydrolase
MTQSTKHSVQFGSQRIDFHLIFEHHDRFRVTVQPDLTVTVDVPHGKGLDQVLEKVKTKAPWIMRQLRFFEQFLPRMPEKRYVSGETIRYLGRQYRLKVTPESKSKVKLSGPYLIVKANRWENPVVKSAVNDWYKERAIAIFRDRLRLCTEVTRRYGIDTANINIRRMKGRWGSCSASRAILLNTELVKAPVHCIDYVIMHELCHFRFRKHCEQFYRFLGKLMPDWQYRKQRLGRVVLDR